MTVKKGQKLELIVARIRGDVQLYAAHVAGIQRDSERLAPAVAAAYAQFKEESEDATKLAFCRLFATEDQLEGYPESDKAAKEPGSAVQSLFNSIEYLLRRAGQLEKAAEVEQQKQQIVKEAAKIAKKEIKEKQLEGEEAGQFVLQIQQRLFSAAGLVPAKRVTMDEVVEVVVEGWRTELDELENFTDFVNSLLQLKYSEKTADAIIARALLAIGKKVKRAVAA